ASGSSITVVNKFRFTVWPGISSSPVLNITGFELREGESRSFQTPEDWSGQIWGRTGCRFNRSGHLSCATGDSGTGDIECYRKTFKPPVTVAKINMSNYRDYYYDLQLEGGGGCKSACQVFPSSPEYCCSTKFSTCNTTLYGQLFVSVCPRSVAYEYYEQDTIGHTDPGGFSYTVIFCGTFSTIKLGDQLTYMDQFVSDSGYFTLGFFDTIGSFVGDGSYIGIWYTNMFNQGKYG
ncbi:G-type lectin S-receptor-like serine/threonine-protein kinase, partial [Tanacetum coccineum]